MFMLDILVIWVARTQKDKICKFEGQTQYTTIWLESFKIPYKFKMNIHLKKINIIKLHDLIFLEWMVW